jgi:hypothetical protein
VTFEYFSLIDSWEHPITSDVQTFLDVLNDSPHIDHIQIICVRGIESSWREKLNHLMDQGDFSLNINYKAKLKRTLKKIYPDAMYS